MYPLDTEQEGLLLLRHLTEQRLQPIKWRDSRPHLLARTVTFDPQDELVSTPAKGFASFDT